VTGSNTTTYAWDFENRLSSVTLPGSGGTVSFANDPFGRRIKKVSTSGMSIYAYDGNNLIEETNSAGAVVARYSDGLNIDEPLAMLRSAATSYYQADGLGSVISAGGTDDKSLEDFGCCIRRSCVYGFRVNFMARPIGKKEKSTPLNFTQPEPVETLDSEFSL